MRKLICTAMVLVMVVVSATSALADGRGRGNHFNRGRNHSSHGNHHGGHYGSRSGVSDGAALLIGISTLAVASVISYNFQQPVQYAPEYQAYPVNPPRFVIGTCFPSGAYFPDGVDVVGRGYFPPGSSVPPGACFL